MIFGATPACGVLLAWRYAAGLPEAPACPQCHAISREAHGWAVERLFTRVSATAVRECARCGWRGRMRWRWALSPSGGMGDGDAILPGGETALRDAAGVSDEPIRRGFRCGPRTGEP